MWLWDKIYSYLKCNAKVIGMAKMVPNIGIFVKTNISKNLLSNLARVLKAIC